MGFLQGSLTDEKQREFLEKLANLQVETMTPLEALNTLYKAAGEARELTR